MVEKYLRNQVIDKGEHPPSYFWMFKRITKFLDRIDDILALESAVFSEKFKFAGRLDCSAKFDGVLSMIDFKNYSKPKTAGQLDTAFTQACLYSIALEETINLLYGIDVHHENLVIIFSAEQGESNALVEKREDFELKAISRIAEYHSARSG